MIDKRIGIGKAHNYSVFPGKIKSIAKEYGMDEPSDKEISQAFTALRRTPISTPDGSENTILRRDKPEYVKLTPHGITLVTILDTTPEIEPIIDDVLGDDAEVEHEWFPATPPEEAPIQFTVTSDSPEGVTGEVTGVLSFPCQYPDCEGSIDESVSFEHPAETWSKPVTAECPDCGETWECQMGQWFDEPTRVDP